MKRNNRYSHKVKIEGGKGLVFDAHIDHFVSQYGKGRKGKGHRVTILILAFMLTNNLLHKIIY